MDEFEHRLAGVLTEAVPEPGEVDLDVIRDLARPRYATARQRVRAAAWRRGAPTGRARRTLAIAGAVVAAAVIAAGTYALTRPGHPEAAGSTQGTGPSPTAAATVTTDPASLTSASWQLTRVVSTTGSVPAVPSTRFVFTFGKQGAVNQLGNAATARVTAGVITLGPWTNTPRATAPPMDLVQTSFVYQLMTGALRWTITGQTLTFIRPGEGSLEFRRVKYVPLADHGVVSGRFLAVGGPPPGSPRPMTGTGTVRFTNTRTGKSETLDTNGSRFQANLPTGTYVVVGRISSYGSGRTDCGAEGPLTVSASRTAHVEIYCQEA